jgi:hypothetical protein
MVGVHGDFHAQPQIDGYWSFPDHDDLPIRIDDSKATMRASVPGRHATIMIRDS